MKKAYLCLLFVFGLSALGFAEFVIGVGGAYDFSSNTIGTGGTDSTTALHSFGFNLYQFYGGSLGLVIQFSMPIPIAGTSQTGSTVTNLALNTYFMNYVMDILVCKSFPIPLTDSLILMPGFGIHLGQLLLVANGYTGSTIDMSLGAGVVMDFFYYFTPNLGIRIGLSGAYDFLAIAAPSNLSYRNGFFITAMADFVVRMTD
jgi:hypothetical protein